jgi:hypothetical protein
LAVCALDSALAEVVRTLHRIATSEGAAADEERLAPWPRYIISNTKQSGDGKGEHWFTVAYSIRRRV